MDAFGLPPGQAFAVARAIGRRGTTGHYPVRRSRPAFNRAVKRSGRSIAKALARLVEQ